MIALLRSVGVEPGDVVAFQLPNSREAIVSFVALSMGGYVLVPIVHIYGRKEVAFILAESGADAYISLASYGHVDYMAIVDESAPADLRVHVVVGEGADRPPPDRVRRIAWDHLSSVDPVDDLPVPHADEVAVLAYTSGTTSDPKGSGSCRAWRQEPAHWHRSTSTRPNSYWAPHTHRNPT